MPLDAKALTEKLRSLIDVVAVKLRYAIAASFTAGFAAGAASQLHGCGPVPSAAAPTVADCQALAIAPFLAANPGAMTLSDGRDLVRALRRCAGKDTVFSGDGDDLFGIDPPEFSPPLDPPVVPPLDPPHHPPHASTLDGGIYRSL